jgi:hypothetical protein
VRGYKIHELLVLAVVLEVVGVEGLWLGIIGVTYHMLGDTSYIGKGL